MVLGWFLGSGPGILRILRANLVKSTSELSISGGASSRTGFGSCSEMTLVTKDVWMLFMVAL